VIEAGRPLAEADSRTHPSIAGPDYDLLEQVEYTIGFARQNATYVSNVLERAEALAPRIPAARSAFFRDQFLTPIRIHLHSLEMLEAYACALTAYGAGDKPRSIALAEQAERAMEKLFAAVHDTEHGKWSRWWIGERFVGLETNRDQIRRLVAALRGQPAPPVRYKLDSHRAIPGGGVYEDVLKYQEPFLKNYPLLYGKRRQG
jgi:hypothetical protein